MNLAEQYEKKKNKQTKEQTNVYSRTSVTGLLTLTVICGYQKN